MRVILNSKRITNHLQNTGIVFVHGD